MIHNQALVCGYGLNSFVQAGLVNFYAKTGDLVRARKVFDEMPNRTIVAWNSMISGYDQNGLANEAVSLFKHMQKLGVEPDSTTFVSVLSACSQMGALDMGSWVHDYLVNNGLDVTVAVGTALINMYTRCGNVTKAREVFDEMKERNVITWTAMISGCGMHGHGDRAIELFQQMRANGPPPNGITFVAILAACAHAGLVREGREAFASMRQDYGLPLGVEHHVCIVDMFGRAGFLDEAFRFIREEIHGEPEPVVWTAMLGACKMHKNLDLGVLVAEHLLSVQPENPGHYVMLSNIFALAGKMDRVEMVRNLMIRKRLKKQVGYSIIELDNKTHFFRMADKSHPMTGEIYRYLDQLMQRSSEAGYIPMPEWALHELEEEEREYALRYHSEKLAIAFGLLKTNPGVTLRIVKNLRMCEDCHSAIKFISVVASREIIVRDKLRFHHFKDGLCSCLDYW